MNSLLPELPLEAWEQSKITLHLYTQIVGKIRLKLMPRKNHWWNITLYVNARGITTHAMPYQEGETCEIQFNFLTHHLEVYTSLGGYESFALQDGLSVAEFETQLFACLHRLGVEVHIVESPFSYPDAHPITKYFSELTEFARYQPDYIVRFWQILRWVDAVFQEFSGRFYGKTCPVHIYWHHLDLTVTRFSGKRGPALPGTMRLSDKDAYTHEVISFGFWAGDEVTRFPAFYSYTYPAPDGLTSEPLQPNAAQWTEFNGSPMALLPYDAVRTSDNPRQTLLDFLESAYQAGAKRAHWNIADFTVPDLTAL
jgi:hypothetical protein